MSEQMLTNLVVQTGAVGIAVVLVWWVGRRLDRVADLVAELVAEVRRLVEQHRKDGHKEG